MGQITYGYAMTNSVSNTTMYSLGVYLPIKNKKQRQQEKLDQTPYNRPGKDDKKDSTSKNGPITINITINMDSVRKSKGLKDDEDGLSGRDGRDGRNGADGAGGSGGGRRRHTGSLYTSLNLDDDFGDDDYKVDTINGQPVVRFVVYFEFNEWGLNSKAFSSIDKVIEHLRHKPNLLIEIKGYTDDVGTNQYNNYLSRRRAKMVLEYMNSRGVPTDYMKAKAYGSDDPVADNKDPNSAWLNRRAEIIVHEK
jgi:outer membrane protein OmpA-like peptidoglycan-associated protein